VLKKIAIVIVLLIAGVLAFAATKPDTFRVERSAAINAPPEAVFPLINDFHNWQAWSPWEKLDPAMTKSHSGAASGQGAVYEWEGNSDVGKGRMEITESAPPSRIKIKLDFLAPFEAHNTAEFALQPAGSGTNVVWAMHGENNFMGKVMQVFMDMDSMIGKDFETGLANMKAAAER
jgi:carbon monoxide dehydrogenase subunit G